MATVLKDHVAEALAGLAVVAVAGWFLMFAWDRAGSGTDRYPLTARFPNVSGVSVGTDVRVSGMKVGTVTAQSLDPASYQAVITLGIDSKVKLPADTSAAITSESLLGGSYIALIPGGDPDPLRAGDEITDTQGSTDLMGLIGSFINRSGPETGAAKEGPAAGSENSPAAAGSDNSPASAGSDNSPASAGSDGQPAAAGE